MGVEVVEIEEVVSDVTVDESAETVQINEILSTVTVDDAEGTVTVEDRTISEVLEVGPSATVVEERVLTEVVTIGISGPPGATGEPGLSDLSFRYVHNQGPAAAVWTVVHGLGGFPNVTVVDSAGTVMLGGVEYLDADTVRLTFSAPFGGKAYFS